MDFKGASNNGGHFNNLKTPRDLNYTLYNQSRRQINHDSHNMENNNITDSFDNKPRKYGEDPYFSKCCLMRLNVWPQTPIFPVMMMKKTTK